MDAIYLDLDLIRLTTQYDAAHLDRQLTLLDNLEDEAGLQETDAWFVNHPVKLSFTIVIFCLVGRLRVQISLQDYELQADDVLVVLAGSIGEFHGMSDNCRMAVIALDNNDFPFGNQVAAVMSLRQQLHSTPLFHLPPGVMGEAMAVYGLMKAKLREADNPFRNVALQGYLQVLASIAYRWLLAVGEERQKTRPGRPQELYDRFMKEVQKNYMKERGIAYYAGVLCVTPKYLSQIVHKVSGRFAGDWISDYVILEAKALLKSRKYTVQQVADRLHFPSQSFFGRYFKEKVGCPPSEYQKS